jgi:ribonuclease BN (tRNA processing enzyme)
MRYIQLGNGGGLNPLATNSSFLVQVKEEEYLLFDCGFNVMQRLIELENEDKTFNIGMIKYVYISHIHDDHVGNLETLMFWNYFKNNISIKFLYVNMDVLAYLQNKIFPKLYNGGRIDSSSIIGSTLDILHVQSEHGFNISSKFSNISLFGLFKTFHGECQSNGLVIKNNNSKTALVISGDTKASVHLEEEILYKLKRCKSSIIYHDYSNWDCPSKNTHACKTDFDWEYSEEFRDKLIKYHDNEDFITDWQEW